MLKKSIDRGFRYFITRQKVQKFAQSLTNIRIHTNVDWPRIERLIERLRPVSTNHELVRIGPDEDGGYLIANDLDGIEACFSPGVSTVADFELQLANVGIPCFLSDYSVDAPPVDHALIHFQKKYLGAETKQNFVSLSDWVNENCPNGRDMILQMDIEGAEIAVILSTPNSVLRRFRHVVIEFHDLENMLDPSGLYMFEQIFDKLLDDFEIVHLHPNNVVTPFRVNGIEIPKYMEFTFIRRDRISESRPNLGPYPHKFDRPNIKENKDLKLHPAWYDRNYKFGNL